MNNINQTKQKLEAYRRNYYENYVPLGKLVPLKTPLTMLVDPTNICNFQCVFCPTGHHQLLESVSRPKGIMKFELFKKITEDLSEFPEKIKVLHLYKDGEPLLNNNLAKMITYAKEKQVAESIQTTTNAVYLTNDIADKLIEAGLDKIRISIAHVTNDGYKSVTGTFSEYDKIRKNIEYLYNEKIRRNSPLSIHVKILDTNLTEKQKSIFLEHFNGIGDTINIDSLMGWSNVEKKDFTLGSIQKKSMVSIEELKKDRKVCPEPFKEMAVNFGGKVSVCCVDWAMGTIVGDVNCESLINIWNGTRLNEFRCKHLKKQRDTIEACANCHYILGHGEISDLDTYRDKLIKKYCHTKKVR